MFETIDSLPGDLKYSCPLSPPLKGVFTASVDEVSDDLTRFTLDFGKPYGSFRHNAKEPDESIHEGDEVMALVYTHMVKGRHWVDSEHPHVWLRRGYKQVTWVRRIWLP